MGTPSFAELAEFVRAWACLPKNKKIDADTLFEDDLGITGDDGADLLKATEEHFGVRLCDAETGYRRTFHLGPHEYLFHSEGFLNFWPASVRAFTVGELHLAVQEALKRGGLSS